MSQRDRDRGLHGEGQPDPDPHQDRPVLRGQHQRGEERTVRELNQEDRAEREGDGREIHRQSVRAHPEPQGRQFGHALPQRGQRPGRVALHGALADLQLSGRLLDREAHQVPQHHGAPLHGRQPAQRVEELGAVLDGQRGSGSPAGRVLVGRRRPVPPPRPAPVVDVGVHDDPPRVGLLHALLPDLRPGQVQLDERLLQHVLARLSSRQTAYAIRRSRAWCAVTNSMYDASWSLIRRTRTRSRIPRGRRRRRSSSRTPRRTVGREQVPGRARTRSAHPIGPRRPSSVGAARRPRAAA